MLNNLEQRNRLRNATRAARLANRVHRPLRRADINSAHAELRRQDRTDCRTAARVVAHDHLKVFVLFEMQY